MNRVARLAVVTGTGLALSLTASPALAAPGDPGGNGAEHYGNSGCSDFPGGSTCQESKGVIKIDDNGHLTNNEKASYSASLDDGTVLYDFDQKAHRNNGGNQQHYVDKQSGDLGSGAPGDNCTRRTQERTVGGETTTRVTTKCT